MKPSGSRLTLLGVGVAFWILVPSLMPALDHIIMNAIRLLLLTALLGAAAWSNVMGREKTSANRCDSWNIVGE
jgi:hypothetical protein